MNYKNFILLIGILFIYSTPLFIHSMEGDEPPRKKIKTQDLDTFQKHLDQQLEEAQRHIALLTQIKKKFQQQPSVELTLNPLPIHRPQLTETALENIVQNLVFNNADEPSKAKDLIDYIHTYPNFEPLICIIATRPSFLANNNNILHALTHSNQIELVKMMLNNNHIFKQLCYQENGDREIPVIFALKRNYLDLAYTLGDNLRKLSDNYKNCNSILLKIAYAALTYKASLQRFGISSASSLIALNPSKHHILRALLQGDHGEKTDIEAELWKYIKSSPAIIIEYHRIHTDAVEYAIRNHNINALQTLLPFHQGTKPMQDYIVLAINLGFADIVELLCNYIPTLDVFTLDRVFTLGLCTPLMAAVREQDLEMVKILLLHKANPNLADENQSTPLHYAIALNNLPITRLLIEYNADLAAATKEGLTPLHKAAQSSSPEIIEYLLQYTKAKDTINVASNNGRTPLDTALRCGGSSSTVELLLNNGATIQMMHLFLAMTYNQDAFNIVKLLISKGADVNSHSDHFGGDTPLFPAVDSQDLPLVELLLNEKADVNARNQDGFTVLHTTATNDDPKMAELLLKRGADINVKTYKNNNDDSDDSTPLHRAIECGSVETIQVMLKHNPDLTLTDRSGLTALGLARQLEDPEIIKLLEDHSYSESMQG